MRLLTELADLIVTSTLNTKSRISEKIFKELDLE